MPNPDAGNFTWVGNPQAILINGKGAAQDCTPPAATAPTGTLATCNVTAVTYPANATASPPTPACSHAEILVEPGKTYLLRLISAVHLIYTTVCFEGHNLTIIAEDDIPVDPVTMPCVDIFSGQRFDVLLTANQTPSAYWMTAYSQYRAGAPNGYAILRYNGTGDGLPATATPQPGAVAPWTSANATQITMNSQLLASNVTQQAGSPWNHTYLQVPDATARLMLNLSQPVLNDTAQIRWAWDNVVMLENPPCENVQQILYRNPGWVQANAVSPTVYNSPQGAKSYGLGEQLGGSSPVNVFVANLTNPATLPVDPQAGAHIIPTQMGDVVEIVIQNNNASSFNGDIGGGGVRTTQETHPLHLHGHRYWLLAEGTGTYPGPEAVVLNTKNPVLVDSVVLYQNSYMVLRYVANNPGTWIFHCHIPFHQIMGQSVVFSEQNSAVSKPPTDLPACPNVCEYTAAPWNISYTDELFGKWIPPNPPPAAVAPAAVAPAASKGLAAMPTLGLLVFLLTAFAC